MAKEKMPFTEHLGELRRRMVISVLSLLAGFAVSFYFSETIFKLLTIPVRSDILFKPAYPFVSFIAKEKAVSSLVFLAPAEAFWVHLKISMIAGLILSLPVIFYQLWKFVSPGLVRKEKRYAAPFVVIATGLFFFGASFCFFVVLPFAMKFLLTYKTASLTPMLSVQRYIDFCLKFILAFGVVFELPVIIVSLTRMGIVTPQTLAKNRKYAVLLAFVAAALLTPTPDAFNQTLMAVPIIFLYEGGILASKLFVRRKPKDDKRQEP